MSDRPYRAVSGPPGHRVVCPVPGCGFSRGRVGNVHQHVRDQHSSETLSQAHLDAIGAQYCDICTVHVLNLQRRCQAQRAVAPGKALLQGKHDRSVQAFAAAARAPDVLELVRRRIRCPHLPPRPGRLGTQHCPKVVHHVVPQLHYPTSWTGRRLNTCVRLRLAWA